MSTASPQEPIRNERGIVLVTAVLFVLLTAILGAVFMTTTVGERASSSNVQIAKSSLYAADAGVRTTQQVLANMARAKMDSLVQLYNDAGNWGTPVIATPAMLFPAGSISQASTAPGFNATASIAWVDSDLTDTVQVYNYRYTITSTGSIGQAGVRKVQSTGMMRVSAGRGSFADYLMFTDTHTTASGGSVWFSTNTRFDGRVHTNGEFRMANKPVFQDLITSVNDNAWFYNGGSPIERNASYNGTTDVPQLYGGFNRGVADVPLPTETNLQQNAALGLGSIGTVPSNNTINTQLGTANGSSAPPNGIYIPHSGGAVTGGIYVQGAVSSLRLSVNGSNQQVYTFVQGGVTNIITLNRATTPAQTTIKVGSGSPTTYNGLPTGSMFVNGGVSDFGGPDRSGGAPNTPVPALADNNQLLITATGDITLQSDVTCKDYHNGNSVLGLYSSDGSIHVGTYAPTDLNIDAFLMAIGTAGQFTVDNYSSGSPRGNLNLRGGMVATYYGVVGQFGSDGLTSHGYGRNFSYDRRGLIPPYYPQTLLYDTNTPSAQTLAWKEL